MVIMMFNLDPLLWDSPAFEPVIKKQTTPKRYCQSCDDKGQTSAPKAFSMMEANELAQTLSS